MEVYGTEEQRIYQILAADGEKTVVKVVAGEIGFWKEFANPEDPLISRIIEFCEDRYFVKLDKSVKVDNFFT